MRTYLLDDGTRLAIDLAGPRASLPIIGSDSWTCLRTGTACAFGFLRHIIGHADTLAAGIGEATRWRVHCGTNRTVVRNRGGAHPLPLPNERHPPAPIAPGSVYRTET